MRTVLLQFAWVTKSHQKPSNVVEVQEDVDVVPTRLGLAKMLHVLLSVSERW